MPFSRFNWWSNTIKYISSTIIYAVYYKRSLPCPGEATLYRALLAAGLNPIPQYPLAGRYLDLALKNEKIDIEVDGMAYHLNPDGSRKADDTYRDLQIQSAGWRVCRFWHYEIESDPEKCVAKVQALASSGVKMETP
ncbi:MAG: DUF559 domain-containing protein [Desulfobulbaceae bacterium]|nr:DUF559 domain-containing protein [Desulfobulbaceae bacterium]